MNKEHKATPMIAKASGPFLWILFLISLLCISVLNTAKLNWKLGEIIRINTFTLLIWCTVLFFSAVVSSFSKNYLKGSYFHSKFTLLCLGFTASVMLFVASNHIIFFIGSWFLMGFFMARLIGVDNKWKEAKEASNFAQKFFLLGTVLLLVGVLIISIKSSQYNIDGIVNNINLVPDNYKIIASIFIIGSAVVQSAIFPFHKWLLSAMTSPTPASALMHAGFVNGAGVLLTLLSTLLISSGSLNLLFVIGGLAAILAQFTKQLQVNVKQKLACSTIAQMGFMIMQCGLGFFNAAVVHLILHGFYKAYLFLSSGEEIERSAPKETSNIKTTPKQTIVVIGFGILGALLFSFLTGKTSFKDSSIFLTIVVAITVGQVTYNILKQNIFSTSQKLYIPILLFISGVTLYALMYNGVTKLMGQLPMINEPQPLSAIQIVLGIIFLASFIIMRLRLYTNIPWLYVKLLNLSQPSEKTIFKSK